jgi:hypothetical protein
MKICSAELTTCGILQDGQGVSLNLIDSAGNDVCVELPFYQAEAVAMTLPSLLTRAVKALTGNASARYVFDLDRWVIERPKEHDGLLLTLSTPDGFQVSFGIPAEACKGLGLTLSQGPDPLAKSSDPDEEIGPERLAVLN